MSEAVHIAHVIYRFDTGGLENGVVNLINHLPEDQYQHSIITLCGRSEAFCQRIKTANVDYFDLAKQPGQDLGIFWRLNRLLKQLKPDVLHTRNTATLECQLVGWWRRVPLRVHGEHGWDVNDLHGTNKKYQLLRKLMRRFVHRFIALSKEAQEYLINTINVSPEHIEHICNGVDDSKFFPHSLSTLRSPLIIGTVGRLEAVKHQVLLLDAAAILAQQGYQFYLHLVGDGSQYKALMQHAEDLGLVAQCKFLGNRSDIPELLRDMDVFVLPSLAEGISNTILEAMASGLPVVATRVGGNPDLVVDGQTGYLVNVASPDEMASRLASYIDDPSLLSQHGQAGRALIDKTFSIHRMTARYDALYRQVEPEGTESCVA